MAYASIAGRARTSATNPRAHAICDRCGFRFNLSDLRYQYDWAGASLINKRLLVCTGNNCLDVPQQQLRSIIIPADPVPIVNARPQNFVDAETDYLSLTPGTIDPTTGIPIPNTMMVGTITGIPVTKIPIGRPVGLTQAAIMPFFEKQPYGVKLPVMSVLANGTPIVRVTCSSAHGLATGAQISVLGLSNPNACGFYNATVLSATVFSYTVQPIIPAGALMTSSTLIETANVGVPLGYEGMIPSTGN